MFVMTFAMNLTCLNQAFTTNNRRKTQNPNRTFQKVRCRDVTIFAVMDLGDSFTNYACLSL